VRARRRGQSLVIVALVLPFLVGFALLVVEVAERWLEVAMVEDALQQATRSAVQSFDYADLARGRQGLRAGGDCHHVTWAEDARCRELLGSARAFLLANLAGVRGLAESPSALAERVRWSVLPAGGTCSFSSSAARPVTETAPLLCAEVRPLMRGIVGWGNFTPLIVAADSVDIVRP
jgi:hypothetical protein